MALIDRIFEKAIMAVVAVIVAVSWLSNPLVAFAAGIGIGALVIWAVA
jgi:hypothetical protein